LPKAGGAYAEAVLKSKPLAFWRLGEIGGDVGIDATGNNHPAHLDDGFARYLPGPPGTGFAAESQSTHATHLGGGRLRAEVPELGDKYSVEFWFWNGLPYDARPITGYLFAFGRHNEKKAQGDHLGLGGTGNATGRLFFSDGNMGNVVTAGKQTIALGSWNHVVLVRDDQKFRVHLNGKAEPEIAGATIAVPFASDKTMFFGGHEENEANLEGKLAEVAIYDRPLSADEVAEHYQAAGMPPRGE
jgi:hypothetical protein